MPSSILKPLDDVDSRREVLRLFQLLTSTERIRFLTHVCKALGPVGQTLKGENVEVVVTNESMDATEAYLDAFAICSQFGIDPKSMAESLEQWVSHVTSKLRSARVYVPGE